MVATRYHLRLFLIVARPPVLTILYCSSTTLTQLPREPTGLYHGTRVSDRKGYDVRYFSISVADATFPQPTIAGLHGKEALILVVVDKEGEVIMVAAALLLLLSKHNRYSPASQYGLSPLLVPFSSAFRKQQHHQR